MKHLTAGTAVALLLCGVAPVAANDARVLWATTRSAPDSSDVAVDVAASPSGIAVAVGRMEHPDGTIGFAVRAYRTQTGAVLWEDFPALDVRAEATAVAIRGGVAVAVGMVGPLEGQDALVRAYDARSGALLWSHVRDAGAFDSAWDVAIAGRSAVVVGALDGAFSVRSLDLRTGALLWEDRGARGAAGGVAIRGRSVVVAGSEVRAYNLASGERHWVRSDPETAFEAVVLQPPFAVVAGVQRRGDDQDSHDFLVRTYDMRSGRVVWSDVHDHAGRRDGATDVAVDARTVVAVGAVRRSPYDAPIVRAYDLRSGRALWSDVPDAPDWDTAARGVAMHANTVVVAASLESGSAALAYDAKRGSRLWQHDDPLVTGNAMAVAMVPGRPWALVAGGGTFLAESERYWDFAVRAYHLSGARPSDRPRLVDLGDGTILDRHTSLRWEKKAGPGQGLQAVDATFTWCADVAPADRLCDDPTSPPDGTAFTAFLPHLNEITPGGSRDWRLPTYAELLSIGLCGHGTGSGGGSCLDPIFGPVASNWYWSSSVVGPGAVGVAEFDFGYRHNSGPGQPFHVRAVRGTPIEPTG